MQVRLTLSEELHLAVYEASALNFIVLWRDNNIGVAKLYSGWRASDCFLTQIDLLLVVPQ